MVVKEHDVTANLKAVITPVTTHFCNDPHSIIFIPLSKPKSAPVSRKPFFRNARKTPRFPPSKKCQKTARIAKITSFIARIRPPKHELVFIRHLL